MTSGLRQKLGKCAMPGAHEAPRRKRTGYSKDHNEQIKNMFPEIDRALTLNAERKVI